MERFVKEYASNKIKRIESNDLMQEKYKQELVSKIERATEYFRRSMLSVDETMKIISES